MRSHLSTHPSEWSHAQTNLATRASTHFISATSLGHLHHCTRERRAEFDAQSCARRNGRFRQRSNDNSAAIREERQEAACLPSQTACHGVPGHRASYAFANCEPDTRRARVTNPARRRQDMDNDTGARHFCAAPCCCEEICRTGQTMRRWEHAGW